MRKKKMVRVSAFILLVVLLSLTENERSSGLPTKIPSNDYDFEGEMKKEQGELSLIERAQIRQILMLAAKEIKDEDIVQVLKKSLILQMKICFSSPLPTLPPKDELKIFESKGVGAKRDEGLPLYQKHILSKVLREALEYIDEEEVLDFLKSSLYFRLLYCLYNPVEGPFPEPGPSPSGLTKKPTPSQIPDGNIRPPTDMPEASSPNGLVLPNLSRTGPVNETSTTSETGQSSPTEDEGGIQNDMADLPEIALKNAIPSISSWNEISDPDVQEGTGMNRDSSPEFLVNGHDPLEQSAGLEGLKRLGGLEKTSLAESISNSGGITKLSQSLPNGKQSTTIDDSDESNDGAVGAASDGVGNAALGEESLTENSDEGEFQSVIMIDYDALADEEKSGTDRADPSLKESNEQLSL